MELWQVSQPMIEIVAGREAVRILYCELTKTMNQNTRLSGAKPSSSLRTWSELAGEV